MKINDLQIQNEVSQTLHKNYGLTVVSTVFLPVGEESYAYIIATDQSDKYFAKYCEQPEVIKNIDKVNKLLLQIKLFPFVVPPIVVDDNYSFDLMNGKIYVYPFIEGEVIKIGNEKFDQELVTELTNIMASIHNAQPLIDLPIEQFENNFSDRLEKLHISAVNEEFENDVCKLLFENEALIRKIIEKHTVIGKKYSVAKPEFVLTHGDITGLNLIRSSSGIKLVDWDGAMFAPAERDINFLLDNPNFSLDEYLKITAKTHFEPELGEYYSQDWSLNSIIGNFVSILNQTHSNESRNEYINEINEYLNYYK